MTDLLLLKKHCPGLYNELYEKETQQPAGSSPAEAEPPKELLVETSSNGFPVLKIEGLHIHSPRDPIREAQRQAEALAADNTAPGPLIILGFGLGYTAEAAVRIFPERPLIIVEKHPEILRKALEIRDLGNLFFKKDLAFVLGGTPDQIMGALSLINKKERPGLIPNRALMKLDEGWYQGVEQQIRAWVSRTEINQATLKRFGRRWVNNLSQNLSFIRDKPGIARLEGLLKDTDIPVFLAAAGPSLELIDPLIHEIKERCVIAAVDTSLRFFLDRGIEPDFAISLDPQYWNFRHLDRVPAPRTFLIAESAVYPACLRHSFRDIFLSGSLFPLGRFIEDRVDPKGEIGAGGSVATAAWDFCRILGPKNIWLAGLDLAFPNLKTHFRGALFEERSHGDSVRFSPGETLSAIALRDGHPFPAKSASGSTVLTDQRLSLYASWFENRFGLFPEVKNHSLSKEGLAIKGLDTSSPEVLLSLPPCRREITSILEKTCSAINEEFFQKETRMHREEQYEKAIITLINGLKDIKTIAEEAADLAQTRARRFRYSGIDPLEEQKTLKKLNQADQAISANAVREVAGFLFPDANELEKKLAKDTVNPLIRHLEFSAHFYQTLAEAAAYNIKALSEHSCR